MVRKTAEERFWEKVDKRGPDECWLWTTYLNELGYGSFNKTGNMMGAHKYSWELHNGLIAKGLKLCHTCDNKHCVNPNHMQLKPISPPMEERFWSMVDKQGECGCWEWLGGKSKSGYGNMRTTKTRKMIKTHRYSWELHNGTIPDGLFCCHHCDNPSCVNPDHLFIGTSADNMQDKMQKGRHRYGYVGRKGEKHFKAKLREADVLYIRKLWKWTEDKPRGRKDLVKKLADLFRVHISCIYNIIQKRIWKHI